MFVFTSHKVRSVILMGVLATSAIAGAQGGTQTFVETFSNRSNVGGWSFGTGDPVLFNEGGRHGDHIREFVISFAPIAATEWGTSSVFTGDWRARNVKSVGIDLALFAVEYTARQREMSLVLTTDNGTPEDWSDDWGAYFTRGMAPALGGGWRPYDFRIESQAASAPRGWKFFQYGELAPGTISWPNLMGNVSQVGFWMCDFERFYIIQGFVPGLDNARISWTNGS